MRQKSHDGSVGLERWEDAFTLGEVAVLRDVFDESLDPGTLPRPRLGRYSGCYQLVSLFKVALSRLAEYGRVGGPVTGDKVVDARQRGAAFGSGAWCGGVGQAIKHLAQTRGANVRA